MGVNFFRNHVSDGAPKMFQIVFQMVFQAMFQVLFQILVSGLRVDA